MNIKAPSFLVFSLFFSITVIAQKTNSVTLIPKNIFKLSLGSHYFYDDFSGNVFGLNTGLNYERLFAKKWSWGVSLEAFFNENNVPKLKTIYHGINLPEMEERYAFSPEIRYYFTKAGQGFFLGNIANIQWVRYGYLTYVYDCITCSNHNYVFDNFFTISDRLTFGYQMFINKKILLGIGIGYELRAGYYGSSLFKSRQISCQFGFGK